MRGGTKEGRESSVGAAAADGALRKEKPGYGMTRRRRNRNNRRKEHGSEMVVKRPHS